MSIRAANSAALSGMQATQSGVAVTSNNIANADVEGYTTKSASMTTSTSAGLATGVNAVYTGADVDTQLVSSIMESTSDVEAAKVETTATDRVASAMGTPGDENALTTQISDLESALASLAQDASSDAVAAEVISEGDALAEDLNRLSSTVQDERKAADQTIATGVDAANASLEALDAYNKDIALAQARGESTADLEDLRTQELENLSTLMDVEYYTNSQNQLQIFTSGGTALLTSSAAELEFSSSGTVTSDTTYPGTLSGVTVAGTDITEDISGGSIGGNLTLRDDTLPGQQDELDALAGGLITEMNTASNAGTATPPPREITGTESYAATDAFSATGDMRVVLTFDDGLTQEVADFDLTTYATVGDLVTDIDAMAGVSASLNADGMLTITADDPDQGISLVALDGAVDPDGESFSGYFGMNDFYTGTDASDIAVNQQLQDDPSLLATATGSDDPALAVGDRAVANGDGSTSEAMANALTADVDFAAAGTQGASTTSIESYAANVMSSIANQADEAMGTYEREDVIHNDLKTSFSNQYGVNLDEEAARLSDLENAYSANAAVYTVTQSMFEALQRLVS